MDMRLLCTGGSAPYTVQTFSCRDSEVVRCSFPLLQDIPGLKASALQLDLAEAQYDFSGDRASVDEESEQIWPMG